MGDLVSAPLNSYNYPVEKPTSRDAAVTRKLRRGVALLPWKCHECWKMTEKVAPEIPTGKNWKRQVNTKVKLSAIRSRDKVERQKHTLLCYPEHCKKEGS